MKRWRPELAGVILVWRDPADGRVFVVNGHHRLALARRLGVAEVDVRFIAARDAAEARAIGALANMAEGRATPVDVAKFIRDSGRTPESLAAEGISLNETLARDGLSLAKLHPQLFASVATGVLPLGRALAIAVLTRHEDQARLAALAEHLERRRTISDPLIREMAADMETAPRQTVEQADLFGSYVDEKSLFLERNQVIADARAELARQANVFGFVSDQRRAEMLADAGNELAEDRNRLIAESAGSMLYVFDRLCRAAGPVADAINDAARKLAEKPKERRAVVRDLVEGIRPHLSRAVGLEPPPVRLGTARGRPLMPWAIASGLLDKAGLTRREKTVVTARLRDRRTLADIGREMGLAAEWIRKTELLAVSKLRRAEAGLPPDQRRILSPLPSSWRWGAVRAAIEKAGLTGVQREVLESKFDRGQRVPWPRVAEKLGLTIGELRDLVCDAVEAINRAHGGKLIHRRRKRTRRDDPLPPVPMAMGCPSPLAV